MSIDRQMDKEAMEYCSVIKANTFELVLMNWRNLKIIIQNEVSQKEKANVCIDAYIWNLERWY